MRKKALVTVIAAVAAIMWTVSGSWGAEKPAASTSGISPSDQAPIAVIKKRTGKFFIGANANHMFPGIEAGYFFPTEKMRVGVGAELLSYNPFHLAEPPALARTAGAAKVIVGSPAVLDVFSVSGYLRTMFFYLKDTDGVGVLANATVGADMELRVVPGLITAVGFDVGDFRHIQAGHDYFLASPHVLARYLF